MTAAKATLAVALATVGLLGLSIVASLGPIGTVPALAQMRTDQLMWQCEGKGEDGTLGVIYCAGYLGGMNDTNAVIEGMIDRRFFCIPASGPRGLVT